MRQQGRLCHIQSVNKEQYGITNGTLLCALSRSNGLCFDGADSKDIINFFKTNNRKKCTFHVIKDDTCYYVSEQNNSICLKQGMDSSCDFEVCYIKSYGPPTWRLIKARSGKYLTNDESGQIITETINKSFPPMKAIYQIIPVQDVNCNYLSSNNINLTCFETSL